MVLISDFCILILGNDESETGLLGSTSKILGTSRIYFEDPCGREKNPGSVCFEQGEAFTGFRNWEISKFIKLFINFLNLLN